MSTGDLEGNIDRLKGELRRTKYTGDLDEAGRVSCNVISALRGEIKSIERHLTPKKMHPVRHTRVSNIWRVT